MAHLLLRSTQSVGTLGQNHGRTQSWAEFDPRAAVQVGDAIQFKRSNTCVYLRGVGYDIDLIAQTQTSRLSGRPRPLKIIHAPVVIADTVAPISGSWVDEDSIPSEMMCPISRAPMTQPVVAEDGFTYERDQIQAWMKKKANSPMTGKIMGYTLIANHTLKALIQAETSRPGTRDWTTCSDHRLMRMTMNVLLANGRVMRLA